MRMSGDCFRLEAYKFTEERKGRTEKKDKRSRKRRKEREKRKG